MKKILKITGMTLLALIILAFGAFYTWSRFTYGPSEALKKQVNMEQVEHKNNVYTFETSKSDTGIILYPGAKVEPLAYAYIGDTLMKKATLSLSLTCHFPLRSSIQTKRRTSSKITNRSNTGILADIHLAGQLPLCLQKKSEQARWTLFPSILSSIR